MTKVIFARKGRVVSTTDTTFTALYRDLTRPRVPPRAITLSRRLVQHPLAIGDTVVWECVTPNVASRIVKYSPPEIVMPTEQELALAAYEPPKYLKRITQQRATPSARYNPLTVVDDDGKRRATGACLTLFVADVMDLFMNLGCDIEQAGILTANAYHETGGGAYVYCENYGGVKVKPTNVKGRGWFLRFGHVQSGDQPIVAYVDFSSPEDYARYAMATFAPKPEPSEAGGWPDVPRTDGDYRPAGKAFYRVGGLNAKEWYPRIVDAGYKGDRTKTVAERRKSSIDQFNIIYDTVRRLQASPFADAKHMQSALSFLGRRDEAQRLVPYYGGKIDGDIGPKSKAALTAFQRAVGLPQTGTFTSTTGKALLNQLRLAYPL